MNRCAYIDSQGASKMPDLFRKEALDAYGDRWNGGPRITASNSLSFLTIILVAITIVLGAWVAFRTYQRVETISGETEPFGPYAKIIANRPGRLTILSVREGQIVKRGQPLATVQTEDSTRNGTAPSSQELENMQRQQVEQRQQEMVLRRLAPIERAQLSRQITELHNELAVLEQRLTTEKREIDIDREQFNAAEVLQSRGYVSKLQLANREENWLSLVERAHDTRQQIAEMRSRIADAEKNIAEIPLQTANKLSILKSSEVDLATKRLNLIQSAYYTIAAPLTGRINGLQSKIGETVDPRRPLMTIMPEHAPIHAILYAPSRSAGFLAVGQRVKLLYDAYPYEQYGLFDGTISTISKVALTPEEATTTVALKEAVYRIEVLPAQQVLHVAGHSHNLVPGMALNAKVVLDRRSFLGWLLDPLHALEAQQ